MEIALQCQKHNVPALSRKHKYTGSQKDLWVVVREGSLAEVEFSLAILKKTGGNINSRNLFGLTPLHIATWRNHVPIVRRLLAAGADPDARDGESGWSSLHRALHFGHLAVASVLLQSGASITVEDSKSRTPVDLISGPVLQVAGTSYDAVATEVYSWGSGTNYQLGTGNAHLQKLPRKVDSLHGSFIALVSAAKFHSVAVSTKGEVYTWGFGRGGRLGHPDFDIHSGQAAVITPRQVTTGLGSRRVRAIAAAKHHTVIATEGGEVFTWGSNREGQLGYTSVDTQPTPRKVSSLKFKIVAVAAANKHTAALSESGEVFTWGCNKEGQLGYGTSNSASNYTPRIVEYLKGKVFTGVTAAKYHTIVLGTNGDVYTWGHRLVNPRRLVIARNIKKTGTTLLKFHRMERLHVVSVAAGMVHSMALTDDGTLFYWLSSDPDLRCQQLYSLSGKQMVNISSSKYWSAAVTSTGDVYMWDGKNDNKDKPPIATRLHGVKRSTSVSVGETHLLIVGSLYHPIYPPNEPKITENMSIIKDEMEELVEDFMFTDKEESGSNYSTLHTDDVSSRTVPSLKSLCEKVAAEFLVEPRSAIQLLEIADSLGGEDLRKYCEDIVIRNLDYILTVSAHAVATASPDILVNLEKQWDMRSSEPWCYRQLPTLTATFPAIINSEEEDSDNEFTRTRDKHGKYSVKKNEIDPRLDCFLQPKDDAYQGFSKQIRALRKKLQQVEMLEAKQSSGLLLDDQQVAKLHTRPVLESLLAELGDPVETIPEKTSNSSTSDGKGGKKGETSRKQRRKSKQMGTQVEAVSGKCYAVEPNSVKGFSNVDIPPISKNKVGDDGLEPVVNKANQESSISIQKNDMLDSPTIKISPITSTSKISPVTSTKKKNKKGGLSMFLSGALDDFPKHVIQSPTPKNEGPAWGGMKVPKESASLREILVGEQSKKETRKSVIVNTEHVEKSADDKSVGKIQLGSFFISNPIPVVQTCTSHVSDGERSTPQWVASGGTPPLFRPSLRDIQMQQEKKHSLSHSPKIRTAGFSVSSGQGSPSDITGPSRWFKPEVDTPSAIRSIQIEERAIKDLKRFYSSVKVIKNQS